ncbi:hypothetical protein MKEN_00549600 [Mycena kentingensis (nom. inval.)]|nr:hypothetical protein MKEN_00549600 [Mycena kentingensis (nom. inval.)]
MARGTLRVLCECIRFCNGGRHWQRSRTTWYAHAPYRIGGRYAHLPYEPSAALNTFLTFGNDSDSDPDNTADDNGDGNTRPRVDSPEVDIDNQPGNGNDNEFYGGGGDGLYGGGGGGMSGRGPR